MNIYLFLFQEASSGSLIDTSLPILLGVLVIGAVILYRFKIASTNSAPEMALSSTSPRVVAVARRYRDGYIVARAINGLGSIIKTTGLALGVIGLFLGVLVSSKLGNLLSPLIIIVGFLVGFVFYVWGVLVSARGQEMKASFDVAVSNSSFLDEETKAQVMSLPAK